jgi:WD40 repeat protein
VRTLGVSQLDDQAVAVAVGDDGLVEVWDVGTGAALSSPAAHHGARTTAAAATVVNASPILVTGCADGSIILSQLGGFHRGNNVSGHHPAPVTAIAALGVGPRLLIVAAGTDRTAWLWDMVVDDRPHWLNRSSRDVRQIPLDGVPSCAALRLSAAGVPMAAFSAGEDVRVWSASMPAIAVELQAPATALAFGDDGTLLIGTEQGVVALELPAPARG